MTDTKAPESKDGQPSSARIAELQDKLTILKQEVRIIQGRLANRDPAASARLQEENKKLKERVTALEKALYAIITDFQKPRSSEEATLHNDVLRVAAVDHFKKANVDPELWKNIVS